MGEGRGRGAAKWRRLVEARREVQFATFALFVILLFWGLQRHDPPALTDLFFRLDPLTSLATMLSAREWIERLGLALVTVGVTLVLGRVWCGWICPLGTLLGWFRFGRARRRSTPMPERLRAVKYILLAVIVAMALLGVLTLLVLDPMTLLTRTATVSLLPAFDFLVTQTERLALQVPALEPAVNVIEDNFRGNVLPVVEPRFEQSLLLLLVFVGVIALNLLADRFWCRYLCPLGALLGLVAKVQVLRPLVGDACTRCGPCAASCRMGAIDVLPTEGGTQAPAPGGARLTTSECTMCLDCLVACPSEGVMGIGVERRPQLWREYDPSRRALLAAGAGGLAAGALLAFGVRRAEAGPRLLRPPGALDEPDFLSSCLRCTECIKACPTSGLQPALGQAGLEGFWTPVLVPRIGQCDYGCTACGEVCPSGAIAVLPLEEKRRQVIGLAVIDQQRCLPWAEGTPCIVCQEVCPVPDKAILLTGQGGGGGGSCGGSGSGNRTGLPRPKMIGDRCIGCGICETKCPVEGTSAIVVQRRPDGSPSTVA